MDREIYDRMAEIDGEHWWFAARRDIVSRLITTQARPPKQARILEIGAGTGSNLAMLQTFGEVEAIEPDDGARALASKRSGIAVKGGLLPDGVELEDGRYDLIVLLDVLEHIDDDHGTLRVLTRKLTPGGKIVLTVPAAPWMWSSHDVAHHHKRRYTAGSFRAVLKGAGLRIRHMSHFNSLLFPPIAAVRLIGKLTGREGGDDGMPSPPVNTLFRHIFGAERYWATWASFPFGVSLLAVVEPVSASGG
jgi:SAM-dependent methyltransferase